MGPGLLEVARGPVAPLGEPWDPASAWCCGTSPPGRGFFWPVCQAQQRAISEAQLTKMQALPLKPQFSRVEKYYHRGV